MPFLFGHNPARAGLSIPSIILNIIFDKISIAPVLPAERAI